MNFDTNYYSYQCFVLENGEIKEVSTSFDFEKSEFYCIRECRGFHTSDYFSKLPNGWKQKYCVLIDNKNYQEVWTGHPKDILNHCLKYQNWAAVNESAQREKIKKLEANCVEYNKRIQQLENEIFIYREENRKYRELGGIIAEVIEINEKGGSGSRKLVRDKLTSLVNKVMVEDDNGSMTHEETILKI